MEEGEGRILGMIPYSQEIRESECLRLKVRDQAGGMRNEDEEGCRTVVACRVVGEE